jgi:tripartite-type tricarboxylate transporter receptor subunit TctC
MRVFGDRHVGAPWLAAYNTAKSANRAGDAAMNKSAWSIVAALAGALLALFSFAQGTAWPAKPVRIVVSFAPGGVHDTLTRLLATRLTPALGQAIVIENRGGANGNIAAESVAKSAPDGYTFLVASEAMATNASLYGNLGYDPYKDLAPVAKLADYPIALVAHATLAANSVQELVALAKAHPGAITYGSAGIGASGHLAAELFSSIAGIEMVHVPYKGGAPALADLMAGRIQVMFLSVQLSAPQVKNGRLKALAIAGRKRAAQLPDVPTTAELGYPQFEALLFSGMFAPVATPPAVIERMSAELVKTLRTPEMQDHLLQIGAVSEPASPREFASILRLEGERWGRVIRERNIHAE